MDANDDQQPEVQPLIILDDQDVAVRESIDLSDLSEGMTGLTTSCGRILAEAAAVCLESQLHREQVCLPGIGLMRCDINLKWPPATDQSRRTYADMQEATEFGACGIAILMVKELIGMEVVERAAKGTGFDYWLGEDDADELPFATGARLEVSGILEGTDLQIANRVESKKRQMAPTDHVCAGYIAIIEFSRPIAHVEQK